MAKKEIHLLYSCDAQKYYPSMRLVVASTNMKNIVSAVKDEIKKRNMTYAGTENVKEALKQIREDFNPNLLEYGYVESVVDGERQ